MGRTEETILESLVALSASEPDSARHMFIVAVNPATAAVRFARADVRTMRAGEVLMACRSGEPSLDTAAPPRSPKS